MQVNVLYFFNAKYSFLLLEYKCILHQNLSDLKVNLNEHHFFKIIHLSIHLDKLIYQFNYLLFDIFMIMKFNLNILIKHRSKKRKKETKRRVNKKAKVQRLVVTDYICIF